MPVLFENSIVCHLMKRTLLFVHEHGREHERSVSVCCLFLFC